MVGVWVSGTGVLSALEFHRRTQMGIDERGDFGDPRIVERLRCRLIGQISGENNSSHEGNGGLILRKDRRLPTSRAG